MQHPDESSQPQSLNRILRDSILQGKNPSLTVISDSMSPLLRIGDQVKLQKLNPDLLQRGCIITFSYPFEPEEMITHRIAGSIVVNGQHRILTWADRTLMFDLPIEIGDIIGLVACRTRNNKHLNLQNGRGAWLSSKLSKLATSELKWITKLNLVQDELTEQAIANSDELRKSNKAKISVRLLRRTTYYWATLLAYIVEYLP